MNIFKDKTEMPSQPDIAVSAVRIPGERLSEADRDMKMAGQFHHDGQAVVSVTRPRFGHKV